MAMNRLLCFIQRTNSVVNSVYGRGSGAHRVRFLLALYRGTRRSQAAKDRPFRSEVIRRLIECGRGSGAARPIRQSQLCSQLEPGLAVISTGFRSLCMGLFFEKLSVCSARNAPGDSVGIRIGACLKDVPRCVVKARPFFREVGPPAGRQSCA
jgi:hypothetical protein